MNENELWELSDEELETAFKEAQAQESSPETEIEEEAQTEETEDLDQDEETESDENEEVSDGPEQPEDNLEDSDHNTSDETEAEETDTEDALETEDEDQSEDEKESSDDVEEAEVEEQPVQPHKFRANGKDYEFSSEEIASQFPKIFGQAMDYTKKMQTIKPWRKTIDALEAEKLSHDDVSLMIDVLKGDKEAITEVLKRTGVDTLDIDTEENSNYVAKDYGRDDSVLAIKDIVDDISRDPEYAITHSVISKDWDEKSWETMTKTPEMIRLLHTDVKSGMFNTIQPLAEKLKVYDGSSKSDLEYYKEAAQQHFSKVAQEEANVKRNNFKQAELKNKQAENDRLAAVKSSSEKRSATKEASAKRKAAAPTKNVRASRDVVDYLDDSNEAFDEWYKQLQDKM